MRIYVAYVISATSRYRRCLFAHDEFVFDLKNA